MTKFQSFAKKHKKGLIIGGIILIVLMASLIAVYQLVSYLMPNRKESQYGDRCELTESIIITDERKESIKEVVESYENMKLSTIDIKCNLIDIVVKVDDSVEISAVKEMSDKMIAVFSKEELKYFELGLYVDSDKEESETYPIIGTKHKEMSGESNGQFVWSYNES